MKMSKRLIGSAMAALMAASALAVGSVSASAASLKKPSSVKVVNNQKSVKVSWKKVKGATKYKVYRGGKLIKTTKKTSYKDYSAKAKKTYTYKVRAYKVKGNKVTKSAFSAKKKIMRLNYTDIASTSNTATGVKIQWNSRKGADTYRLYRKTTGGYTRIATTKSLSYTDTNVVSGTKYTYRVACVNSKTNSKSYYSAGKSRTYVATVTGVSAQETAAGDAVNVKWDSAKGATSYAVYRQKITDASFKKIATVKTTSYTDKDVFANPTAYTYKVVALSGSTESYESAQRLVQFMPKRPGENVYYTDSDGDIHIKLIFNTGDVYREPKAYADYLSLNGMYTMNITKGADVVAVNDSVITAKAKGEAVVTVKVNESAKNLVTDVNNAGVSRYAKKTIYLEITVK